MATPGSYSIQTLGCKLNYAESSTLSRQLENAGWNRNGPQGVADLYILNTCSVTEFADKKCRQAVRRYKRDNPRARVIVTGCYAQLKPEEIVAIEGVDLVLGAAEKFNLLHHVEDLQQGLSTDFIQRGDIGDHDRFHLSYSAGDRTRAFLKIQDGCDYKCSFCTIPKARGKSRSATIDAVVTQASQLIDQGIKEIVLTGVNIGDFGIDPSSNVRSHTFLDLIQELDQLPISRIRISSIEPNLCTNEIIQFVAKSNRFMPHLHMPLQSGSDTMLFRMRRRYKRELYADRVDFIKAQMPHACIGVDVIVGFHGESEVLFQESVSFIRQLDVSYLHVFTYSERSDTPAETMDGQLPISIRKSRNKIMRDLSIKKQNYFYNQHVKSIRPALFESSQEANDESTYSGYTDNYIKVAVSNPEELGNKIRYVELGEVGNKLTMRGITIQEKIINH